MNQTVLSEFEQLSACASGPIGLAVSGGSDSLALLYLASDWSRKTDQRLYAFTVDHGLRPEAAEEAQTVARHCADLGIGHRILTWQPPAGHVSQAKSRRARHSLLAEALRHVGGTHLMLAHTLDDQLETVAMRATRPLYDGSTALAGMRRLSVSPIWPDGHGIFISRPCLSVNRQDLRSYLTARKIKWIEDPSNQNRLYERIRVREDLTETDKTALMSKLEDTAAKRRSQDIKLADWLDTHVEALPDGLVRCGAGTLDAVTLAEGLAWVIMAAAGTDRRADQTGRMVLARDILAALGTFQARTLGGAWIAPRKGRVHIARDPGEASKKPPSSGGIWDGRFLIHDCSKRQERPELSLNLQQVPGQTGFRSDLSPMTRKTHPSSISENIDVTCLVFQRLETIKQMLAYEKLRVSDI